MSDPTTEAPAPSDKVVVVEPADTGIQLGGWTAETPADVIRQASAIATELSRVIDEQELFTQMGKNKHINIEGWATLGAMVGVSAQEGQEPEQINLDGGWIVYKSNIELIRLADGAIVGRASAICSNEEKFWRDKSHNAIRSMATTRAAGKAYRLNYAWIVVLAGYSGTPSEEMPDYIEGQFSESKKPKVRAGKKAPKVTTIKTKKPIKSDTGGGLDLTNTATAFWAEAIKYTDKPTARAILGSEGIMMDYDKALAEIKKQFSEAPEGEAYKKK